MTLPRRQTSAMYGHIQVVRVVFGVAQRRGFGVVQLMRDFIAARPELWNEDIGV